MSNIGSMISGTVLRVIIAAVFITVGFALGPAITDAIATVNLTGVALSSVLTIVIEYIDFIYYLGVISSAVGMVLIGRD